MRVITLCLMTFLLLFLAVEALMVMAQLPKFGSIVVSLCAALAMLQLLRMLVRVELTEFVATIT